MNYKGIAVAVLITTILVACASKSSVPTTEVKKEVVATKTETIVLKKEEIRTAVTKETLAEGLSLYEYNCAKCHKLYAPKDFSAEEWKPIVARMQRKAKLNDLEGQKILAFLTN
jgi:cytochrome c5